MSRGRFHILEATKQGYAFTMRHASYLARAALLPIIVDALTAFYVKTVHPDAGNIEEFLWLFPSGVTIGWFMFIQTRLMLLCERLDRLPRHDAAYLQDRVSCMRASIIISLLFGMLTTLFTAFMVWATQANPDGKNTLLMAASMMSIGAMFWGLRFGVAHIVAAAGYPLKKFIFTVNGIEFSLRLVGLTLAVALPIMFAFQMLSGIIVTADQDIGTVQTAVFTAIISIVSVLMAAILNAAATFALKEVLGKDTSLKRDTTAKKV
jgi:hypothetical protein